MNKIVKILMERDEISEKEAMETYTDAREAIADGEDPEEVLYDLGLYIDDIFDFI